MCKRVVSKYSCRCEKKFKDLFKHTKIKLTSKNRHMSYIPRGFANGLQTLEDNTELVYFTTNFYKKKKEVFQLKT